MHIIYGDTVKVADEFYGNPVATVIDYRVDNLTAPVPTIYYTVEFATTNGHSIIRTYVEHKLYKKGKKK